MRLMNAPIARKWCAVLGGLLFALGSAVWRGAGVGVTRVHVILGLFFALSLSALAVALVVRNQSEFGYGLLLLVIVMAVFGITHPAMLPGPHHWVVRCVHLLIGAVTIVFSYRFAGRLDAGASGTTFANGD